MKRIAIAIGIERAGHLIRLPAAVLGAKAFHGWASKQGYESILITDEVAPVTLNLLFRTVSEALEAEPERLLIFFSGHGTATATGDVWLLSDWNMNGNEAVDLRLTFNHARRHPVGQIAILADACRSVLPEAAFIGGGTIFPFATREPENQPQWDQFLATRLGHIAQEYRPANQEHFGMFTKLLMAALMCEELEATERREGSERVVTSPALGSWLNLRLPFETGKLPGGLTQYPDVLASWRPLDNVYATWPSELEVLENRGPNAGQRDASGATLVTGRKTGGERVRRSPTLTDRTPTIYRRLLNVRAEIPNVEHDRIEDLSAKPHVYGAVKGYVERSHAVLNGSGTQGVAAVQLPNRSWLLCNVYPNLITRLFYQDDGNVALCHYSADGQLTSRLSWSTYCTLIAKAWNGDRLSGEEVAEILKVFAYVPPEDPALTAILGYHFDRLNRASELDWLANDTTAPDSRLINSLSLESQKRVPFLTPNWGLIQHSTDVLLLARLSKLREGLVPSLWTTLKPEYETSLQNLIDG
ncbi:hypothetical protein [Rhizobium azibense]|uniref:Caspase domain-containing protein n=1 Tax=Rhizobium azibense TaxID=1136135 RepID=A0A4R3RED7_9HYPH|nr:hypothetical protein [Rhizobium azibense]TCU32894.1 hypothetical protein EV129_118116 [Rhizobium azibense]